MTTTAIHHTEDNLDDLLASLGLEAEPSEPTPAVEDVAIGETELEAAVMSAEAQESVNLHCEADPDPIAVQALEVEVGIAPAPIDLADASEGVVEKPKKEKKASAPRKHYADRVERITDTFGATLGEYMVLEIADASLTGDDLAAKQTETLEAIKSVGVKVKNRVNYLMDFAAGKSAKLNEVATVALTILKTTGKLETGEKGNFQTKLREKYSPKSANSMGSNTVAAMKTLKMIQGEKGEYSLNPMSLYAMKIVPMLGL